MELGVFIHFGDDLEAEIKKVHDFGFRSCQLNCWNTAYHTDENVEIILAALKKYDVTISTFWAGWSGPVNWNFTDGPHTLGLVPEAYRHKRIEELKSASDFAKKLGIKNIATHVGFIPENPTTTEYNSVLGGLKNLASYITKNEQYFLFETGQETPVTLLRTMQALEEFGCNVGLNLDAANLILYGKANPVDALDVVGKYVRDTHCKDGFYPTDGNKLGKQVMLGEGKVNYPALIAKLKEVGYDGPMTIEMEISGGEQHNKDILCAKAFLEKLL